MELLFRAKFRIVGSSVHCTLYMHTTSTCWPIQRRVFSTFSAGGCHFSMLLFLFFTAVVLLALVLVLLLISFLFHFGFFPPFSWEHTQKLSQQQSIFGLPTHFKIATTASTVPMSAHTSVYIRERERERDTHKLTIKTKFSSQKYWLLDAEHTFNTSVQCCVVLCMNMLYYPKIGADNATLKMNSVKTSFFFHFGCLCMDFFHVLLLLLVLSTNAFLPSFFTSAAMSGTLLINMYCGSI